MKSVIPWNVRFPGTQHSDNHNYGDYAERHYKETHTLEYKEEWYTQIKHESISNKSMDGGWMAL